MVLCGQKTVIKRPDITLDPRPYLDIWRPIKIKNSALQKEEGSDVKGLHYFQIGEVEGTNNV